MLKSITLTSFFLALILPYMGQANVLCPKEMHCHAKPDFHLQCSISGSNWTQRSQPLADLTPVDKPFPFLWALAADKEDADAYCIYGIPGEYRGGVRAVYFSNNTLKPNTLQGKWKLIKGVSGNVWTCGEARDQIVGQISSCPWKIRTQM